MARGAAAVRRRPAVMTMSPGREDIGPLRVCLLKGQLATTERTKILSYIASSGLHGFGDIQWIWTFEFGLTDLVQWLLSYGMVMIYGVGFCLIYL